MNTFFKRNQNSLLVNQITTLFWKEEIDLKYNNNGAENFIYFIITNINPNEWFEILKENQICETEDEVENLKGEEELKDINLNQLDKYTSIVYILKDMNKINYLKEFNTVNLTIIPP